MSSYNGRSHCANHQLAAGFVSERRQLDWCIAAAIAAATHARPNRPMVSQVRLNQILWWTQCVFLAGAVAMFAYSGFGLMEI